MDEQEIKNICTAAMLTENSRVAASLTVMEGMMEEVVHSSLCCEVESEKRVCADMAELRADVVAAECTREEMLAGAACRKNGFVVVPQVIR